MGILKQGNADVVYTIRFLKLLVTKFEDTGAFKAGIIDKDGNKNKDFNTDDMYNREAYRTHYTSFHRLVFNLKKIMAKTPGGSSFVARYGAALALIKEHGDLSDRQIDKIHAETGIDILDVLSENSQWYLLNAMVHWVQGLYRMRNESMTLGCVDVRKGDQVRVTKGDPTHNILGAPVFEGVHMRTGHRILFASNEITR